MIAGLIYDLIDPPAALFILYGVITVLSIICYQLGFARKLPVLKSALVYVLLMVGCVVLTMFGAVMPIADILLFGVVALAIARYRRYKLLQEEGIKDFREVKQNFAQAQVVQPTSEQVNETLPQNKE